MANQGCVNEGNDTRTLGWVICPLQRLFSFKSDNPPNFLIKIMNGNFVSFGIAWPPYIISQVPVDDGYSLFRLGWRYDNNWEGYIFPTGALKTIKEPMEEGY